MQDSEQTLQQALQVTKAGPVLLYDGECGVCNGSIQWVLRYEKADSPLRFAALQSDVGRLLRAAARVPDDVDSFLWIERTGDTVAAKIRTSALLRVAGQMRGAWRLLQLFFLVPRFLRDACYAAFAKVRHRVVSPACLVPLPEQRARFLS